MDERITLSYLLDTYPYDPTKYKTLEAYYSDLASKSNGSVNAGSIGAEFRRRRQYVSKDREWLTTRRMTGPGGETIHEVHVAVPVSTEDKTNFEAVAMTSNPYGGDWVRYDKKRPDYTEVLEKLNEKYKGFKPPRFTKKYRTQTESCAVINMFDAHIDKIAVKAEVGYDSTLDNNIARYKAIFEDILMQVQVRKPEKIIFPVGNDLYHTNAGNRTKKGTPIQYLCSEMDAYEAICDLQIWAISMLLDVAPVYIPFIKGNHDEDKVNTLAYWMDKMFSRSKHFECNKSREQRKYVRYGVNLLGFAHGDKEKSIIDRLPLIMAEEAKQDWAETTYRKWYCGDLHHNFEYKFLKGKDFIGCNVEFLRSVSVTDAWHKDFGYIGVPLTAEANIWDKNYGNIADLKVNRPSGAL